MDASYALHFKAQGFVMRGMQRAFEPLQGRMFPGFSLRGHHRASAVWQHPAGGFTARVARGLLHRLLHLADVDALLSHPQAGRSWESMVSEEIPGSWNGGGSTAAHFSTAPRPGRRSISSSKAMSGWCRSRSNTPACPFLSAAERVLPTHPREPAKIEVGGVNLGLIFDRQHSDVGVGCERTAHADRPQAGQQ